MTPPRQTLITVALAGALAGAALVSAARFFAPPTLPTTGSEQTQAMRPNEIADSATDNPSTRGTLPATAALTGERPATEHGRSGTASGFAGGGAANANRLAGQNRNGISRNSASQTESGRNGEPAAGLAENSSARTGQPTSGNAPGGNLSASASAPAGNSPSGMAPRSSGAAGNTAVPSNSSSATEPEIVTLDPNAPLPSDRTLRGPIALYFASADQSLMSPREQAGLAEATRVFNAAMAEAPTQNPQDPVYFEYWKAATRKSDDMLRSNFGWKTFDSLARQAVQITPEEAGLQ